MLQQWLMHLAKGYDVVSGGTDNQCMLIDLRSKNITGKDAENALVKAHITVNKNMVPLMSSLHLLLRNTRRNSCFDD